MTYYIDIIWRYLGKRGQIELALVLFLCAGAVVFEAKHMDRFYPGVVVGEENIGGKSYGEVFNYFKSRVDELSRKGLVLSFEGESGKRTVKIPIYRDGLTSDSFVEYFTLGDWEGDLQRAYAWGRLGGFPRRILEKLTLVFGGKTFAFSSAPHDVAIQSLLARELKNFFKEATPAHFAQFGAEIGISKEKTGESLNNEKILALIREKLAALDSAPETFKAGPEDSTITSDQLEPFLKLANDLAKSTKVVFSYQDRSWKVSGATLATWLTLKDEKNIGIDSVKLESFLAKNVAPVIDNPPQNSRFEMRDKQLVEIVPGRSGNVVNVKKTSEMVERIVFNVQKSFHLTGNLLLALDSTASEGTFKAPLGTLEIPVEISKEDPKVTKATIDKYKINDLIGYSKTAFKGSTADRKHNIENGVSKLSGLIIPPGAEFSTVGQLGSISEASGFVKEYVIKDNRSIKELGGGLCQVATTLFRLALDAGLPILERKEHRYVVGYYGPGLDATIYGPKPDFRFKNDTGNYVLLQGKVEGTDLILELYGHKDGRSVSISEPVISNEKPFLETKYVSTPDLPAGTTECSETPKKGMTADVVYTVQYSDGAVKQQNFRSVYQPWGKVCLIGTGTAQ